MSRPLDRVNRVLLVLLGLLLLATGGVAVATALGAFGEAISERAVLDRESDDYLRENPWIWWAVAGVCLLVAILALRWLFAQFTTNRVGRVVLQRGRPDGDTVVRGAAVSSAMEEDVQAFHGVRSARVQLHGDQTAPTARLVVGVEDRADLAALRQRIEHEAVPSLRQCLDAPSLPVHVRLQLSGGRAKRVL